MQQKEENPIFLLLKWAGRDKYYLYLSILAAFISGLCTAVPYFALYRLMDSVLTDTCTRQVIVRCALMAAAAVTVRFTLFGLAGVLSHKGAYGALFKVRCMVTDHLARVPLGALGEHSTTCLSLYITWLVLWRFLFIS